MWLIDLAFNERTAAPTTFRSCVASSLSAGPAPMAARRFAFNPEVFHRVAWGILDFAAGVALPFP